MPDLRRIQDEAAAAVASGAWAAAAGLYAALEKSSPADGTWPLRLGECLRKLGKSEEAMAALTRALKAYTRQQMRNKAVAVCRLMLELDPRNPEIPAVLAWLSSKQDDESAPGLDAVPSPTPAILRESGTVQIPVAPAKPDRTPLPLEAGGSTAAAPVPDPAAKPRPRVVMPRTKFFTAMSEQQLRTVNERAKLLDLDPGQILYAQGDPSNALFLVASGQMAVLLPHETGRLGRGDFFGEEVAVLPDQPRMATTRAVHTCQLHALDSDLVKQLVAETPALLDLLTTGLRERLIAWLPATNPMLAALDKPAREALMARLSFKEMAKGTLLYDSRAPDADLFLLLAGKAVASLDGRVAEHLRPGDIFGEIALVTDSKVRAIATASEKCFILRLARDEFAALRQAYPAVGDYLVPLAQSRLDRFGHDSEVHLTSSQSMAIPSHVLLIHADTVTLHVYEGALSTAGFLVDSASEVDATLRLLSSERFDVVVCDLDLLAHSGVDLLSDIRQRDLDVPIILTTSDTTIDTSGATASHGVVQTLVEPIALPDLLSTANRAAHFHRLTVLRRQAMARLNTSGEWMGDRAGLEHQFRGVLGQLWMAFQPIISCASGDVVAFEALLRSNDELLRSPLAVLRAAERLRRLHEVGRLIRDKVASAALQAAKPPILCINLHHQDLLDPHLLDPKSPLSSIASQVILELTERTSFDELTDLRTRLSALRALGYRFAIDNLGAGHASVATLAQVAPDLAKLDMSLIRGIDTDEEKQELVRGMLDLCRDIKVQVVCEGVETMRELEALVGLGADFMQGFLFAKPGRPFPAVSPTLLGRKK
jgi:EAL domain-containing protein (putative c-di-GMP-specific phosphodiesterase class I)/CRP-like cAMP-binding protein